MPEFHERDAEHQEWKRAVMAKEIELEDIDLKDHKRLAVMDAMSQEGRHRPSQEEIAAKMAAKEKTAV